MRSQPRWRSCRHSLADPSRLPVRFDPVEQPARTDARVAPRSSTRAASPRSAVTTATTRPAAAARATSATIVSSPSPPACTTSTGPVTPSATPPRARPSSTRTTCARDRDVATSRSCSRAAAPDRSFHQPSGRDPTTFAPSTTSTSRRSGAVEAGFDRGAVGPARARDLHPPS